MRGLEEAYASQAARQPGSQAPTHSHELADKVALG